MAEKVNLSVGIVETRRTHSQTLWSHATGHADQFLTRMFNGNRINPPGDTAGTSRRQAVSRPRSCTSSLLVYTGSSEDGGREMEMNERQGPSTDEKIKSSYCWRGNSRQPIIEMLHRTKVLV